jgi:periplasmic divalent cation tolerance protein
VSPVASRALLAPARGTRIVLVAAPDDAVARAIARALVLESLAACVSLIPIAASVYSWENRIVEDPEVLLLIKARATRVKAIAARVREMHPYQVPEILVVAPESGLAAYLRWVAGARRP